jgi:hypothetical protein
MVLLPFHYLVLFDTVHKPSFRVDVTREERVIVKVNVGFDLDSTALMKLSADAAMSFDQRFYAV